MEGTKRRRCGDLKTADIQIDSSIEWLEIARSVLQEEARAIEAACERLDGNLTRAVHLILQHKGKVIVSGIGKSGHVAQKVAATLCSTGTPAIFLHAAEAVHGDLGVYTPGDPSILISKSGSTAELLRLVPVLRQFSSPLIAIVGNMSSPLALQSDVVLDARVSHEADPLHIVPTASTIVSQVLGDALAAALMAARHFTEHDYLRFHPAGNLGRSLGLQVSDVMHTGREVAWVSPETSLKEVVIEMTRNPLGAACVVDGDFHLYGLITDGDIRRALHAHEEIAPLKARDILTAKPVMVSPDATLKEAAHLMEDRPSQISVLPVIQLDSGVCLGLLRIHDIYQTNMV